MHRAPPDDTMGVMFDRADWVAPAAGARCGIEHNSPLCVWWSARQRLRLGAPREPCLCRSAMTARFRRALVSPRGVVPKPATPICLVRLSLLQPSHPTNRSRAARGESCRPLRRQSANFGGQASGASLSAACAPKLAVCRPWLPPGRGSAGRWDSDSAPGGATVSRCRWGKRARRAGSGGPAGRGV